MSTKFKFYRTPGRPTVILGRDWAEEDLQIDKLLKEKHGPDAKWRRIFAFGAIANHLYYLYKRGHKRFILDDIHFHHDYGDVYSVVMDTKAIFEGPDPV